MVSGGVDVVAEDGGIVAVLDANFRVTRLSKLGAVLSQSAALPVGRAIALARQADGKLIVAGQIEGEMAAVRYLSDLTLDSSFGTGGLVKLKLSKLDAASQSIGSQANDVLVQADGKIVLGGSAVQEDTDLALVRLQDNGTPDPTFGKDGAVITDLKNLIYGSQPPRVSSDEIFGIALQPDGKIVAVGQNSTGPSYVAKLLRYLPDGKLDPSFSEDGIVSAGSTGYSFFRAVAVQPDGQIVAGGTDARFSTLAFLQKFAADGAAGPSVTFKLNKAENSVNYESLVDSLALQSNGDVIVGGHAYALLDPALFAAPQTFLARFSAALVQDTGFAGTADGNVLIGAGSQASVVNSPDSRLVAATSQTLYDTEGKASVENRGTVRFYR
ncbi:hypothetical protein DEMA109039_04870 [Deinococcus marmoris]